MHKIRLLKTDGVAVSTTTPADLAALPGEDEFGWLTFNWTGSGGYLSPTLLQSNRQPRILLARLAAASALGGSGNSVGVHPRRAGAHNPPLDGSQAALTYHVTAFTAAAPIRLMLFPGDGLRIALEAGNQLSVELIIENLAGDELDEVPLS